MNDPQFDAGAPQPDPAINPYDAGLTEAPRKPRGCFFYGCIIALILGVLALLCVAAASYMAYSYYSSAVQTYTATAPAPLPKVEMPADDRKALDERVQAFKKALDNGESADLVLTADEINALIEEHPQAKGRLYITITGDQVSAQVSYPLGETGLPLMKGRYLNGSGSITGSIQDGELIVHLQDLEVNGKKLPPEMKSQFARENLAKSLNDDPNMYRYIRKFESLKVKDGKVYIKAKARARDEPDADADADKSKADGADKDADKAKSKAGTKDEPDADEPKASAPAKDDPKASSAPDTAAPKPASPEPKSSDPRPDDAPKAAA